jgi:glycosyltransferase involved in cell wall biosynthesis
MKVVFVNRYFYPDHSATSQLLSELASDLFTDGRSVHVVTSRQLYDDAGAALPARDEINGVHIYRVWTSRFGRANLFGRAVDYVTFYLTAFLTLVRILDKGDLIVAKTDPPLISFMAAIAAWIRHATLVNWLQDLFPEVAERLGVLVMKGFPALMFKQARNFSLRRASMNVVLGTRMAEVVRAHSCNVRVIHNWADSTAIVPMETELSELRREWKLGETFVIAYSGNMGRAHDFETILSAMEALRNDGEVLFLFIGGGVQASRLREETRLRGLDHLVLFKPYQPKELLSHSLGAAQVHLVTLRPALEGLIVPSKFYGIAAAGRPILFIGDPNGEIADLLSRYQCGYAVGPNDVELLVRRIREMRDDHALCRLMGEHAREALLHYFDRPLAVAKWQGVLDEALSESDGAAQSLRHKLHL